jgi:hypothetical protein
MTFFDITLLDFDPAIIALNIDFQTSQLGSLLLQVH